LRWHPDFVSLVRAHLSIAFYSRGPGPFCAATNAWCLAMVSGAKHGDEDIWFSLQVAHLFPMQCIAGD